MVRPLIEALTRAATSNTPLAPPPLTDTPAVGPVIVCTPVLLVRSSTLLTVIVCGAANTVGSKVIVLAPPDAFAWVMQ